MIACVCVFVCDNKTDNKIICLFGYTIFLMSIKQWWNILS